MKRIVDPQTRQIVADTIYDSSLALNDEDWNGFLGFCDNGSFHYRIVNYSPEIRKEQCWMDRDWKGMKSLFDLLPKHNSNHSPLTRHATVQRLGHDGADGDEVLATSLLTVYRTQLDGMNSHFESGQTILFAVGKYEDRLRVDLESGSAVLLSRDVKLDTRQIDVGSHIPF